MSVKVLNKKQASAKRNWRFYLSCKLESLDELLNSFKETSRYWIYTIEREGDSPFMFVKGYVQFRLKCRLPSLLRVVSIPCVEWCPGTGSALENRQRFLKFGCVEQYGFISVKGQRNDLEFVLLANLN